MKTTDKIKKYLKHGLCVDVRYQASSQETTLTPYDGKPVIESLLANNNFEIIKAYHYKDYKPYEVGQRVQHCEFPNKTHEVIGMEMVAGRPLYSIENMNDEEICVRHTELIPVFEGEEVKEIPQFEGTLNEISVLVKDILAICDKRK